MIIIYGFSIIYFTERRPLTYTSVYKTPPSRRTKDHDEIDDDILSEKKPIIESNLNIHCESRLMDSSTLPTINYSHNHLAEDNTYTHPPTMADFKQMAMDAYNQRNNQNVSIQLHIIIMKKKNK